MIYHVEVTQEDFDMAQGREHSTTNCLVATAIHRQYPWLDVRVGIRTLSVHTPVGGERVFILPLSVVTSILAYAGKASVLPYSSRVKDEEFIPCHFSFDTETGECV